MHTWILLGSKETERDNLHLQVDVLDCRRFGRKDWVPGIVFISLTIIKPQKEPSSMGKSVDGRGSSGKLSSDVAALSLIFGQGHHTGANDFVVAPTEVTIPYLMMQCRDAPYG